MGKSKLIIYWIATAWLSLGMVSTGITQLLGISGNPGYVPDLGYPAYVLPLLGISKLLGVIVILIPHYAFLKEWAYAGFTFLMTGAIFSHLAVHDAASAIFPALLLMVLTFLSWWFRPASRSLVFLTFKKTADESRR